MARAARKSQSRLGGLDPSGGRRVRAPGEARVLRAIDELRRDVRRISDVERAVRVAARNAASLFRADDHSAAVVTPGVPEADLICWTGPADGWHRELMASFARGDRPDVPPALALARLRRRDRPWGSIALRWDHMLPDWDLRNALTLFARGLNDVIADIDRDRIAEVRARIDRKVMEQLRSRDLFYQILDGLQSLTRFDHSATLLIGEREDPFLEIAAEKMAWRRGKSRRVGQRIDLGPNDFSELSERGVTGFRRDAAGIVAWDEHRGYAWLEQLTMSPMIGTEHEPPPIGELLVAPASTRDGLRAVLVVGAVHADTFGEYEMNLLGSFLPQVSVALQNSRRTEALEAKMLETERKQAMADLARGVAHDVNNALGAVVPLLQQMREDLQGDRFDQETLQQDVEQIEKSVRVCRDIFGGMLRFARTAARPSGSASVRSAVDMSLAILGDNLRRHRIRPTIAVPEELPRVSPNQSELEQLLLNLVTNARDAMPRGGSLHIEARLDEGAVLLEVADDGRGIPNELIDRVLDPFFTTKSHGNGLGLSICRSIVWRSSGDMRIESDPDRGTRVSVRLPVVAGA
ncbi:MAG: sensor histidine kinase [Planctomycetota bacterium]|jgi:signal transduction histidine kinase